MIGVLLQRFGGGNDGAGEFSGRGIQLRTVFLGAKVWPCRLTQRTTFGVDDGTIGLPSCRLFGKTVALLFQQVVPDGDGMRYLVHN